jgi:hypothetical protein
MDFDISRLLADWEYQPGKVVVRKFTGKDGREKLQLRVDLGLLQMEAEGRPDGRKPYGHPTLYAHYKARLYQFVAAHEGSDEGFKLNAEDCSKLQLEALQFHHRYICLLQLEEYAAAIRDAEHNVAVFDFVERHAATDELSWFGQQFRPQLIMVLTRARAAQALQGEDYDEAIRLGEQGLEDLRVFYREHGRNDAAEQSGEIHSLLDWLDELRSKRPLSAREKLEQALDDAVRCEDYERAAKVRDELRKLPQEKAQG